MNRNEIMQLIWCGFAPSSYYKRSVWLRIERIMEYLANKGYILRVTNQPYKYAYDSKLDRKTIEGWADEYMRSPFVEHLEEMKALSYEMHLPMNDIRVLREFLKTSVY